MKPVDPGDFWASAASRYPNYRRMLALLREHCPAAYPVSVRRVHLPRHLNGRCYKHGNRFYIEILSRLPEVRAIDTLIHELGACAGVASPARYS
jgi:hypothetical protein